MECYSDLERALEKILRYPEKKTSRGPILIFREKIIVENFFREIKPLRIPPESLEVRHRSERLHILNDKSRILN